MTHDLETSWFQGTGENLTTTAVAAFAIVNVGAAAREESVISLGGVGSGNCLEVRTTATGNIKAVVQAASATGATSYTGQTVGIFLVYRPGSSLMSVYVKPVGGATATITPTWAGVPSTGAIYVLSGWNNSSASKLLRLEYWTGTDADSIGASAVGEFFTRRGF